MKKPTDEQMNLIRDLHTAAVKLKQTGYTMPDQLLGKVITETASTIGREESH